MKNIVISLVVVLLSAIILCFIPFNANKFIPILQNQVYEKYGVNAKVDKLIIKLGPSIILKSPSFVVSANNKNFSTISGIKIKLAILPLIRKEFKVKEVRIDNLIADLEVDEHNNLVISNYLKTPSSDNIIDKIRIKHYNFKIIDTLKQSYLLNGNEFILSDFVPNSQIKIATTGKLIIDNINHLDYDISLSYKGDSLEKSKIDIIDFIEQIKEKQASASIVSNLKIERKDNIYNTDGTLSIDKLTCVINGKKLPYSHANFTMLGNKTTISSVLYTNPKDKICVNGYFTNNDNPSFNISVKSSEINLNDLFYFARLFSDVANLDKIKDINGTLYSDFSLKGSLKKIKSNGVFRLNNANIITDAGTVKKLNADIDFSDNHILIKSAKAFVNNAPVVITGDIISNKLNVNLIVDKFNLSKINYKNIYINNAVLSVFANISGTYNKIVPKLELNLSFLDGSYASTHFRVNNLSYKSENKTNGNIIVSYLIAKMPNMKNITVPQLKAYINESEINVDAFNVLSDKTKVHVVGKILNYNNDKLSFSFTGSGFANPQGLFNLNEFDNIYPVFLEINGDKNIQNINFQALQQKTNSKIAFAIPVILNFSAKYNLDELKILDASINSYNGIFSQNLKRNIVNSNKYCLLTGSIFNLRTPEFKNIKLNFLKTCPINIEHYQAKINGNIVLNGFISKPEIIGNIKLPMISDKYGCFSARNVNVAITKNIINFDCTSLKLFDSVLSLVGTLDAKLTKNLNIKTINIKSKEINLENLFLASLMSKNNNISLSVDSGTMYSEKVVIPSTVSNLILTDMNSGFSLNNNLININNITGNLYNGKVAGKAEIDLKKGFYKSYLQGRGISVGPVMKSMTNLKETIAGKLDFDMDISSSTTSKLLKDGNIKFIIKDGEMSILGKVEHLLYAQNIIADSMAKTSLAVVSRAISAKDTGLFKYLNGILSINNDMITIHSIKMAGPNMSMYVSGHYGLMSNIANVVVLGRLSNTLVSSLGSFGTFTMDKFRIALQGESDPEYKLLQNGVENIPQLPQRNTKEFRAIISGPVESKSSVRSFMWISESEKEYKTREIPQTNVTIPSFIDKLPY